MLPSILAAALLVFILAAEQFGVPAVLGTPAKIRVLTTGIWEAQSVYPSRDGLAAALSTTLLIIALAGLWLHKRALGARSYVTVAGKRTATRRMPLGPLRWPMLGVCLLYLLLAVVLPIATIFVSSIRTLWTADFRWEQFTLANYYRVLFDYPAAQRAIVNSLLIATTGATATILLCAFIAFLSSRTRLPGRKLLDTLTMIPMGFPGIVLAVGLLHAWIAPPLVLYGTIWILYVAYMTRYLPIGVRTVSATLVQIHPELEESSLSSRRELVPDVLARDAAAAAARHLRRLGAPVRCLHARAFGFGPALFTAARGALGRHLRHVRRGQLPPAFGADDVAGDDRACGIGDSQDRDPSRPEHGIAGAAVTPLVMPREGGASSNLRL